MDATQIISACEDDAAKWAKVFMQHFPESSLDEGTMIGWFANAIEIAHDVRLGRQADDDQRVATKELNSAEAVMAFAGWLTSRDEPVTMSGHHDAAGPCDLVTEFMDQQGLPDIRDDFGDRIKPYSA